MNFPAFSAAHLWSYVLDPSDTFSSDHFLLIAFFDFLNIHDLRTPSYLKQRLHYHTEYNIHAALPNHKILFTAEVDSGLKKFTPANGDGHLNNNWHRLKFALLNAAHSAFLKRVISLNKPQAVPFEFRPIIIILAHFLKFFRFLTFIILGIDFFLLFVVNLRIYFLIRLLLLKSFLFLLHFIQFFPPCI